MKRKVFFALAAAMLLSMSLPAFADDIYADYDSYDAHFSFQNGAVTDYTGTEDYILVPSEDNGKKITEIAELSFAGCKVIGVALEDGIKKIGKSAFKGSSLVTIDFSASLESVESEAFMDCNLLDSVNLVTPNVKFGKDAFKNTDYIEFWVPCSATETELETLKKNILKAKGDDDFDVYLLHNYDIGEEEYQLTCTVCGDSFYLEPYDFSEEEESPYDEFIPDDVYPGDEFDTTDIDVVDFDDVAFGAWYRPYVNEAVKKGIINGKSEKHFAPDDDVTVAEAVKLAACAHAALYSNTVAEGEEGKPWYDRYVEYCKANDIIEPHFDADMQKSATRAEIAYLFSRADRERQYINDVPITDIPDVDDKTPYFREIINMFNLGAAVGSDASYTFHPLDNVKRSEAAAMIIRIVDSSYRIDLPKG